MRNRAYIEQIAFGQGIESMHGKCLVHQPQGPIHDEKSPLGLETP